MLNTDTITFDNIKSSFSKYVVTPITQFGLGGFVFDIEGETQISLTADITDHFTEANFSVQDHIALKPKKVKLDTYVGELVYYGKGGKNTPIEKLARKLVTINSYLPALTSAASQAKSFLDGSQQDITFAGVTNTALNIYGLVKNITPPLPKQQQAYQYFKALYESKTLMSLQTPFEFCTNMAIESITAVQDEDTKFISNFAITLKEIRMVSTISINPTIADGRADLQDAIDLQKGTVSGVDIDYDTFLTTQGYL